MPRSIRVAVPAGSESAGSTSTSSSSDPSPASSGDSGSSGATSGFTPKSNADFKQMLLARLNKPAPAPPTD